MKKPVFLIIGGAVADITLCPVDDSIFSRHSTPLECIPMSSGGDAMNEASVLAALGDDVALCTLLGRDDIGQFLFDKCCHLGIKTSFITRNEKVATSVNVVLVDAEGERRFVTAARSSLRLLGPEHVDPCIEKLTPGSIVCFASIFVSPVFGIDEMITLFRRIKSAGCILCADMTRCKNGETAEDLKDALMQIDFLFMNEEEGRLLTQMNSPEDITRCVRNFGVKNAIVKLGKRGCYVDFADLNGYFAAYPDSRVLDTTGAGDTFAAAFMHALGNGRELTDCVRFANAAASICTEHRGCACQCVTRDEIEKRMRILRNN